MNPPTHLAGVLDFASGAIGTLVTSSDVWDTETPLIEIYGSEGMLGLPASNMFGGPVQRRRAGENGTPSCVARATDQRR